MAGAFYGGKVSVTGTATNITSLLGLSEKQFFSNLIIRSDTANAGRIWFGKSNVTVAANQLGFIDPGEWFSADIQSHYTNTSELYLIAASPGDVAYVAAVS